jgi:methionyl-tRNA formyltransferase
VTRVRTVFIGSGGFGIPTLRAVAAHPSLVLVGVVTAPARPVGRRQVLTPTPIAAAAAGGGLPILTPERLRSPDSIAAVLALDPSLIVLADYGQIVPPALVSLAHGALNLHPSLLPRHRGATPIPAAILAGDTVTGVTLMRMDEGLDSGPIVAQTTLALDGTETAPALEAALAERAGELFTVSLDPYLSGARMPRAQPADGVTLTRPLRREDGRLDATKTALELERQVRAYQPWPGTYLETSAGRMGVLAATVDPLDLGGAPGRLLADGRSLALVTASGRLRLDRVQPAGGKPMDADVFLRGRPDFGREVQVLP